jgi:hypothetical protein
VFLKVPLLPPPPLQFPASLLQTLLVELMRITIPAGAEAAKYSVVDLDSVSDEAAFAIQLYHRWYVICNVQYDM